MEIIAKLCQKGNKLTSTKVRVWDTFTAGDSYKVLFTLLDVSHKPQFTSQSSRNVGLSYMPLGM